MSSLKRPDTAATTSGGHDTHPTPPPTKDGFDASIEAQERDSWDRYTPRSTPWSPHHTPFSALVSARYRGKGTAESPYLIGWLEDDVENPQALATSRKVFLTGFVSIATLAVALASSAYSGALESIHADLGGSQEVLILGISLFVVGFAVGPLFFAPLSEFYGRRIVFIVTYSTMTLWQAVSPAAPNLGGLLAFRFLAGAFGSSALTNSGGTIADVWHANHRGLAMALFAAAPFLGPTLGPITGGFLGESAGWRWVFGFLSIFSGVLSLAGVLLLSETYSPYLLRQRAKRLSKLTGKHYVSALDEGKDMSIKTQFNVALARPWQLLAREPIVVVLSLYIAIVYAILYSFFSAFPLEFQTLRGWSPGIGGLAFLGILVGMILSLVYVIVYENPRYVRIANELGRTPDPEQRLPAAMVGGVLNVIGLAWFTGTNGPEVFWLVPIMASAPFGAGMVLIFLALQNFLVDAYLIYAASVLAANSLVRSLLGAAFPLFTDYLYNPVNCPLATCGIKVGAGVSLALSLLCLPAPFVLYKKGAQIRRKCKYAAEAARIFDEMNGRKQQQEKEVPQHEEKEQGQGSGSDDMGDIEKAGAASQGRDGQPSPTDTAHDEEQQQQRDTKENKENKEKE